ncbi:MAG TPA: hypothetical protein VF573_14445 [Paraburkholderia sp.]|uniref:hypothetical protein n=1 Tax=Paraburkholderia sp. TaxID=1926495 RepID=UPI002ED26FC8
MKKLAILAVSLLAPLLATAQEQIGKVDGATVIAPANQSIPTDADGAHIVYRAMASVDGLTATELGSYTNAQECVDRLAHAFESPWFDKTIHQRPIVQLVCVATRSKA